MKLTNVLTQEKAPILSLEITPPDRGRSVDDLFGAIDGLMEFAPKFISVTYHQPHTVYEEVEGVIHRRPRRKKPGTVGISAAIKNRYDVTTIPHLICGGFDRFETEDALIDLHYLGMENILALRGDPAPGHTRFIAEKEGHRYAFELVTQISAMNRAEYLDELDNAVATDFCIGVAAYPEKHAEAPNLDKDLAFLKQKVEAGADFIITQMFFSFDYFRRFVEKARAIGITAPIIPGIKPVTNRRQIEQIPRLFFATMPQKLVLAVEGAKTPAQAFDEGTRYMAGLYQQLLDFGVPGVHLFIQEKSDDSYALLNAVYGT